jgi:hypothetical protein
MTVRMMIAVVVLWLVPQVTLAQTTEPADAPAAKGKCAAEVQKFCATVEKGKGLIHACLESHSSELSEGCKTSMAEHAAKAKEKAQ